MNTQKTVKVGLIGTGVTLRTHLPGLRRTGQADIVGVVGSSQKRAEEFAAKFQIPNAFEDYRRLCELPELDMVFVGTPNKYHYDQIMYALQQGKHIYAEKPLAMTLEETRNLATAAAKSNNLTIVGHQLRFNPYLRKVHDLIHKGVVGRPYFIRIHQQSTGFSNREAPWSWSFDEELGGGVRLAMASHLIDLLWFWVGYRQVYSVTGGMDTVIPERKDLTGNTRPVMTSSFFCANMAVEENLAVQLSATAAAFGDARFDFSIYGTEGEVHFDLVNKLRGAFSEKRGLVSPIDVDGVTPEEAENKVSIFSGSFVYFAPRIIEAIQSHSREPIAEATTFDEAIPTQQILDAIKQSSISGETVKLVEGYKPGAQI